MKRLRRIGSPRNKKSRRCETGGFELFTTELWQNLSLLA